MRIMLLLAVWVMPNTDFFVTQNCKLMSINAFILFLLTGNCSSINAMFTYLMLTYWLVCSGHQGWRPAKKWLRGRNQTAIKADIHSKLVYRWPQDWGKPFLHSSHILITAALIFLVNMKKNWLLLTPSKINWILISCQVLLSDVSHRLALRLEACTKQPKQTQLNLFSTLREMNWNWLFLSLSTVFRHSWTELRFQFGLSQWFCTCFYARKRLLLSAHLSRCNSVRLSVRLSHGSQKQCKLGSPNLHHRLPGRL